MLEIEAMELVERFFELGKRVVSSPNPSAIFLAGCRECLPEWELQAARPVPSVDRESRVVPNPRYIGRLLGMHGVVSAEIIRWMNVSTMALLCSVTMESLPAKDVTLRAKADAKRKEWSALWWGTEPGFSKFCADAELTCGQLLGLAGGRPLAVEIAGQLLHGDARADGACAEGVRQRVWGVWQSGNKP